MVELSHSTPTPQFDPSAARRRAEQTLASMPQDRRSIARFTLLSGDLLAALDEIERLKGGYSPGATDGALASEVVRLRKEIERLLGALKEIKREGVRPLDSLRLAKRQYRERGQRMLDIAHAAIKDVSPAPPSPSFWPGDVQGGMPGYTDHEEVGPIGAGTPHARMQWFWERMRPHEKLIEELTDWSLISSKYTFEAAIADAFDKLAEERKGDEDEQQS